MMTSEWDKLMDHIEGEEPVYEEFFEQEYAKAIVEPDISEAIANWSFSKKSAMKAAVYKYWCEYRDEIGGFKTSDQPDPGETNND